MKKEAKHLLDFIAAAPSPYHVVERASVELEAAGFHELRAGDDWEARPGGRYYTRVYDSAFAAFVVGEAGPLRMAAAHTDWPCFHLKQEASVAREGYELLSTEPYGGLMLRTWLDRPLALAGKVALRGKDPFRPETRLYASTRPLLTIPSLAIHMDRDVNKDGALNAQTMMLPIAGLTGYGDGKHGGGKDGRYDGKDGSGKGGHDGDRGGDFRDDFFTRFLAGELSVHEKDILSYDLSTVPVETGTELGLAGELLSAPRLDNLTSVAACLAGIKKAKEPKGIRLIACFDNEEIGSRTKSGAAGTMLPGILRRLYRALGSEGTLERDLADGFLLSIDVAHGTHPGFVDKMDPTIHPVLGGGVVLKEAASQSYAGDAEARAIVTALAKDAKVPLQHFANRSDTRGGSTIGSMTSANLSIRTADIGVPLLAMHSARELMSTADQTALEKLTVRFLR